MMQPQYQQSFFQPGQQEMMAQMMMMQASMAQMGEMMSKMAEVSLAYVARYLDTDIIRSEIRYHHLCRVSDLFDPTHR